MDPCVYNGEVDQNFKKLYPRVLNHVVNAMIIDDVLLVKGLDDLVLPSSLSKNDKGYTKNDLINERKKILLSYVDNDNFKNLHPVLTSMFTSALISNDSGYDKNDSFVPKFIIPEKSWDDVEIVNQYTMFFNTLVMFKTLLCQDMPLLQTMNSVGFIPTICTLKFFIRDVLDLLLSKIDEIYKGLGLDKKQKVRCDQFILNTEHKKSVSNIQEDQAAKEESVKKQSFVKVVSSRTKKSMTKTDSSESVVSHKSNESSDVKYDEKFSQSILSYIDNESSLTMKEGSAFTSCKFSDIARSTYAFIRSTDKMAPSKMKVRFLFGKYDDRFYLYFNREKCEYEISHPFLFLLGQKLGVSEMFTECTFGEDGYVINVEEANVPVTFIRYCYKACAQQLVYDKFKSSIGKSYQLKYNFIFDRKSYVGFVPMGGSHQRSVVDPFVNALFPNMWIDFMPPYSEIAPTNFDEDIFNNQVKESPKLEKIMTFDEIKKEIMQQKCNSCATVLADMTNRFTTRGTPRSCCNDISFLSHVGEREHIYVMKFNSKKSYFGLGEVKIDGKIQGIAYDLMELTFGCFHDNPFQCERILVNHKKEEEDGKYVREKKFILVNLLKGATMLIDNGYLGDSIAFGVDLRNSTVDHSLYSDQYNLLKFDDACVHAKTPFGVTLKEILLNPTFKESIFNFMVNTENFDAIGLMISNYNKIKGLFDYHQSKHLKAKDGFSKIVNLYDLKPFLASSKWIAELSKCAGAAPKGVCRCQFKDVVNRLSSFEEATIDDEFEKHLRGIYLHGIGIKNYRCGHFGFGYKGKCEKCNCRTISNTFRFICCRSR